MCHVREPVTSETPLTSVARRPSVLRVQWVTQLAGVSPATAASITVAMGAPSGAWTSHMCTSPVASSTTTVSGTDVPVGTTDAERNTAPLCETTGDALNDAPASERTASCVAYRLRVRSPAFHWNEPSLFCWAMRKSSGVLPCDVVQAGLSGSM